MIALVIVVSITEDEVIGKAITVVNTVGERSGLLFEISHAQSGLKKAYA